MVQAQKFAIVVQLLLGEIPDRATFREPFLRKTLVPYFQLTQGWCTLCYNSCVCLKVANVLLYNLATRSVDL